MDPVRPDYRGASTAGLLAVLFGGAEASWVPTAVAGARTVVLLVLDGLGWTAVEQHRDRVPTIAGLEGSAITTVVPSTTGSALTSITTGLPPSRHGVVGYRMRVGEGVLNVLRWEVQGAPPPPPVDVQPHRVFAGRPVPVVTRWEFAGGGFTGAHLRGARVVGWRTTSGLVEHCRRLAAAGERFVFAYYDGVDQVAHAHGLEDGFFAAELQATDRLVADLLGALPGDVALVVTSDHGQVHFGHEGWRRLDGLGPLVDAYGGDGRFRYLYARPGAARELLGAAREQFDDVAWVLSRAQLCDEGWLGTEPPSRAVRRRVGDVVLAAREPVAFVDPRHLVETGMRAGHGSLTPDEMLVPLLAARGRA